MKNIIGHDINMCANYALTKCSIVIIPGDVALFSEYEFYSHFLINPSANNYICRMQLLLSEGNQFDFPVYYLYMVFPFLDICLIRCGSYFKPN